MSKFLSLKIKGINEQISKIEINGIFQLKHLLSSLFSIGIKYIFLLFIEFFFCSVSSFFFLQQAQMQLKIKNIVEIKISDINIINIKTDNTNT